MAARLVIEGGVPLRGEVRGQRGEERGAAALAASLLTARAVVLENVPALADVATMRALLERLGDRSSSDRDGHTRRA